MSQHDTLTQALQDAASSLETISRLAGKAAYPNGDETCMVTFPEVRGYATSRAAVARAAISATHPDQAKQSDAASEVFTALADHCPVDNGWFNGRAAQGAGDVANVPLAWQTTRDGLLAYVLQDDLHNRLTPRVIDIAYTAFMYGARGRNAEDGSQRDWFNDTKPAIEKAIAKLRKDLFAASGRQE